MARARLRIEKLSNHKHSIKYVESQSGKKGKPRRNLLNSVEDDLSRIDIRKEQGNAGEE